MTESSMPLPLVARLNLLFHYVSGRHKMEAGVMVATQEVLAFGYEAGRSLDEVDKIVARSLSALDGAWRHAGDVGWRWSSKVDDKMILAEANVNFDDLHGELGAIACGEAALLATGAKADLAADLIAKATGAIAWRRVRSVKAQPWDPDEAVAGMADEFAQMARAWGVKKEIEMDVDSGGFSAKRPGL